MSRRRLGIPVEGFRPDVCASYVGRLRTRKVDHTVAKRHNHAFGQYTDDSQLARELMVSYGEVGRFDPADYAARIRSIFAENQMVGRGLATEAAARRLAAGVRWEEAGTPAPQAGNGAAMRAAPVGLLFADDAEQLIRVAHDQGRITHKDLRCSAGSVAIADAVALVASDDTPKSVSQLSEWMRVFHEHFADHVLQLTDWLKLPPQQVAPTISCCTSADFLDDWKWISPFVIPRVPWSLTAFCEHRKIIGKLLARPLSLAVMWIALRQWLEPSAEPMWAFGDFRAN